MSGAPNIPILKYTTYETWKDPTIKSQWYEEEEKKEFTKLEVNNAFGTCGSSSEGQKCTLGYKYTATTLRRHRGLVNGIENIMAYSVNADSDTNVKFNGIGYSPRWIYVINPLKETSISMDIITGPEVDVRMYNYGGASGGDADTRVLPGIIPSTQDNLYGKVERSFYPFQDALYVNKIDNPSNTDEPVISILKKKKTASEKNITEFIIEHQSKATTDREKLWLVIPMGVNYYEKMEDGDKNRGIQPSSHFERALQWMYKQWVSDSTDIGNPVEAYYSQPVELGDAIPKLMSSSPYTYIKHEYDGTVHHILHFKYEKVMRIHHKFNIGFISGIDGKKAKIGETKFKNHDIPRNVEIYQTNESGAELIKNYKNKVRSKKGVNMVCRPVKIGGDNDEKNFVVAQEKVDEAKTERTQLDIMKRLQGPGMIFGIALMMLILLIFIIPVGMYYVTTGKSIPIAFFLVLGTLLIAPIVFYIISNGIFNN